MSGIKSKIESLLAKAKSTDNKHEAGIFMAKAVELMNKHQIEIHDLDESDEVMFTDVNKQKTSIQSWKIRLIHAVAALYGCEAIRWSNYNVHTSTHVKSMRIVGRESAVQTFELMFDFILKQVSKQAGILSKQPPFENRQYMKREISKALSVRIWGIIREREKAEKEIKVSHTSALVKVSEINAFVAANFKVDKGKAAVIKTTSAARDAASKVSLAQQVKGCKQTLRLN